MGQETAGCFLYQCPVRLWSGAADKHIQDHRIFLHKEVNLGKGLSISQLQEFKHTAVETGLSILNYSKWVFSLKGMNVTLVGGYDVRNKVLHGYISLDFFKCNWFLSFPPLSQHMGFYQYFCDTNCIQQSMTRYNFTFLMSLNIRYLNVTL